ncbi:MAG: nucleotidyltransferase family protein [Firmicutes bacterium]|nr:nucleotidyltransferase family protein [Bacillota bacterium]
MKIAGIIAEYNPFHNGHALHIRETKRLAGADYIIVVMSGSFVQRGEPAMFDKWSRTRAALSCGADMVIELPSLFSASSAKDFATEGVRLLDATKITDCISFGSEAGEIAPLEKLAGLLLDESPEFSNAIKEHLSEGNSYAASIQKALEQNGEPSAGLLSGANNLLGIEYIKAIKTLGAKLECVTVKRKGSSVNEEKLVDGFPSAQALRHAISLAQKNIPPKSFGKYSAGSFMQLAGHSEERYARKMESLSGFLDTKWVEGNSSHIWSNMPKAAADIFLSAIKSGLAPVELSSFEPMLAYRLRTLSKEELSKLAHVSEGRENALKSIGWDISEALKSLTSKRYTRSGASRMLISVLLGHTKSGLEKYRLFGTPYIRILGFRRDSEVLLGMLKEHASLPVLVNTKNASKLLDEDALAFFMRETIAEDIYALGAPLAKKRLPGRDFTEKIVII